jgi:hydrogenase expression/formation protein HypC
MCLGVPGMVTKIEPNEFGMTMGSVNFAGITKEVCLAYVPEVKVGEYVIVHVGFALSKVGEREAQEVFQALRELGELAELDIPQPDDAAVPGGAPARGAMGPRAADLSDAPAPLKGPAT